MKYWILIIIISFTSCSVKKELSQEKIIIELEQSFEGQKFEIEFLKGESFYHPTFAIWSEDMDGNYLETIYVTRYVAKGKFGHGELSPGKWTTTPGLARRPATLPYWSHKRGIMASDSLYIPSPETAVPDALTSATPQNNFILRSALSKTHKKIRLMFEINQPWDSNRYWNNSKYSGDKEYYSSLQPALVYEAIVDLSEPKKEFKFNLIGHSHPSGLNGDLFADLSTFTTALNIVKDLTLRLK